MNGCWVVVADSSRVRLFRKGSGQELEEFDHLDDETRELIRSEIAKNFSRLDPAAIRNHLPEYL